MLDRTRGSAYLYIEWCCSIARTAEYGANALLIPVWMLLV